MRTETTIIKKLGINGEGIGYINKKICFIKNALVGEEVEVEIVKEDRKYLIGEVTKYISTSSSRVEPLCGECKNCLGCSLLHMNYADQLPYKKGLIKDAIGKYTSTDPDRINVKAVLAAKNPTHYKKFVSFPIAYYKGGLHFGIYQRETKYLTFMDNCAMQDELINKALVDIQDILNKHHCRDYNDKIKKGLRFLQMKNIEGSLQVVFVTGNDGISEEVTKDIEVLDYIKSIFFTINTARYQEFTMQGYKKIYGDSTLSYHYQNQKYIISVKSQIPVNQQQTEAKYEILKSMIKPGSLLSLYCQTGILELQLDNEVVAIDEENYHIKDAQTNAKFLHKDNVTFLCKPVEDEVTRQCKKQRFDTILVQLRKENLSEDIIKSIILSKIPTVILVGENASSLAKDLSKLEKYYAISMVQPIDAEPYSPRVESIIELKRRK